MMLTKILLACAYLVKWIQAPRKTHVLQNCRKRTSISHDVREYRFTKSYKLRNTESSYIVLINQWYVWQQKFLAQYLASLKWYLFYILCSYPVQYGNRFRGWKRIFYYSVPTLHFLHKHLWGPRNLGLWLWLKKK